MRARERPLLPPPPTADELFSREQIDAFLTLISQGIGRNVAAQRIGSTGTEMRALARPERDPVFARRYEEAVAEGKLFYPDRLAAESRSRALDGSDRMLEVELATWHPEYAHLRRDRMAVSGKLDLEHSVVLPLVPHELDTWEPEELERLRELLVKANGGDPLLGDARALGPGAPEQP